MLGSNFLEDLSNRLQEMEKIGKVDISIVSTIDKVIDSCNMVEGFWRDNNKVTIKYSFLLYHASRNARIVLEKMKRRFIEAEKRHENPSVVHDSMGVIPSLSELCGTLSSLARQTLNKQLVDNISEKVEYLRDAAYENDLLPTLEEEMEELDKKRLKKRFCEFAGTLQAMFV